MIIYDKTPHENLLSISPALKDPRPELKIHTAPFKLSVDIGQPGLARGVGLPVPDLICETYFYKVHLSEMGATFDLGG